MPTGIKDTKHGRGLKYTTGALLVMLAALLASTNPDLEDYSEFAAHRATLLLVKELCQPSQGMSKFFSQMLNEGCAALIKSGGTEIREFMTYNTERQNFILFSLYTTELPSYSVRTLGILHNFYILNPI